MFHHVLTDIVLTSPADTDIWRKPPAHDVFNVEPTYLDIPAFTPNQLERALITFTGAWKHQFDQAGVILHITNPEPSSSSDPVKPSWVKTGIEFFEGQPYLSFVGCDRWADWSISPLRSKSSDGSTSIELEVKDGTTLWAYEVELGKDGEVLKRYPIRECTWPLHDEQKKKVKIGAYACRPAKKDLAGDDLLKAHVSKMEVNLRKAET